MHDQWLLGHVNKEKMWQLKYKNEFLDTHPGETPEIEKRSPLFLIDDFLAEYSTPITIPYTDKNSRLLGHYFFSLTTRKKMKLDVEVHVNRTYKERATLVIESAGMNNAHNGAATLSGYLLLGISDFFSLIQNKKLSSLELGGQRTFDFTSFLPSDGTDGYWQHAQDTWNFTHDYVFAPCKNLAVELSEYELANATDYTGWMNMLYQNEIDTNMQPLYPWPKLSYVLNEIFKEHGWTLDTSGLNDTDWQRLLIFSAYKIPTTTNQGFRTVLPTQGGRTILLEPRLQITIELQKAMPQDVTCATFLIEICKRYGWIPICNSNTRTCRLIALKEIDSQLPKDWTNFAHHELESNFTTEERTFAFKNTIGGNDSYPSEQTLDDFALDFPVYSFYHLPTPTAFYDDKLIYTYLDNKYYQAVWDEGAGTRVWLPYNENIFNKGSEDATDTYETACSTLPVAFQPFREEGGTTYNGLFPICNQPSSENWGIRTLFWHGMVKEIDNNGNAGINNYPYASSTHISPTGDSVLTWSNVYEHPQSTTEYGIVRYWFDRWINLNQSTEQEIQMSFTMPLYELLRYQWYDTILIHNVPYFIKTYTEILDYQDRITISATLQRISVVSLSETTTTPPPDTLPDTPPGETNFFTETVIHLTPSYYSTQLVRGSANGIVAIEVTSYTSDNGEYYVQINGVEKMMGDVFTVTLDPSGTGSFTVWISPLSRGAHGTITFDLTIVTTSEGIIGTANTHTYSKSA